MAITQTGAMYKSLSFDNTSSRSYGVYITGEAVYNAPERAVEMISIPGRNGAFALDKGRFENIEVKYPAGIFAETEADFVQAISDFRNFLCSKQGYCRLTDEYNPNEYRMAVYKSGLEVEPAQLRAGEFEIVFECKPQRFLTSGETLTPITNNSSITNPTLFDARPMLQVYGYGNINLGNDTITINSSLIGVTAIGSAGSFPRTIDVANLNTGDRIFYNSAKSVYLTTVLSANPSHTFSDISLNSITNGTATISGTTSRSRTIMVSPDLTSFYKGTSGSIQVVANFAVDLTPGSAQTFTITFTLSYNGTNKISGTGTNTSLTGATVQIISSTSPIWYGDSTRNIAGNPLYIDLDIGEAWNEDSGTPASVNNAVELPANLSVLKPGATSVSFDNTITKLDIIPRWWKI